MKYAQIRSMDISNGEDIGIALFTQGCDFHCPNCFNKETWDWNAGKEWDIQTQELFINMLNNKYVKRVSILGGEPLHANSVETIYEILSEIKRKYPDIKIWLYTGYTLEEIFDDRTNEQFGGIRQTVIKLCDIVVDGRYIDRLKDATLLWRGSSNQRVIDVQKSLEKDQIVLFCD